MTVGFSQTSVEVLHLPTEIPEYLPYAVDDCSLAFHLGFRNRIMWYAVLKKDEMYKVHRIPKKRGGIRLIHAPIPMFKVMLQQLLYKFLEPLQEQLGNHVTAYRPGKSAQDAVTGHIPKCPVCDGNQKTQKKHDCPRLGTYIHMDLEDFFPNTQRTWIRHYFHDLGYSHEVASLLANLMTVNDIPSPYKEGEKVAGVPQGAPTSGAICNLIADQRIDTPILAFLDTLNTRMGLSGEYRWHYTRYSDDLSFTCGKTLTEEEQDQFVEDISKIIYAGGYRVNRKKTRGAFRYHRKVLLGMVFNQKTNVEKMRYLKFRAITHNCLVNGFNVEAERAEKPTAGFKSWLRGNINYIGQVHPDRGAKLLAVYNAAEEAEKANAVAV